jgi:hypothetical protein
VYPVCVRLLTGSNYIETGSKSSSTNSIDLEHNVFPTDPPVTALVVFILFFFDMLVHVTVFSFLPRSWDSLALLFSLLILLHSHHYSSFLITTFSLSLHWSLCSCLCLFKYIRESSFTHRHLSLELITCHLILWHPGSHLVASHPPYPAKMPNPAKTHLCLRISCPDPAYRLVPTLLKLIPDRAR